MKDIVAEYEAVEGDLERMEPVEGAEEHTYRFMRMMRTALKFAKAGDHTPVELGKYEDGSYEAVMPSFSASGWKDYVRLTVKDGLITDIDFNAQKESDPSVLITDDPDLNKEGATDSPSVYYPAIAKAFTDSNENLDSLSVPTGGAAAAKSFQKLMKPLLASMISGGGTQITAPRYVDGTYKAQMKEFDEHGWKDYVVVQIRSDKVSVKEFDAVSKADENKLKSQDAEMAAQMEEKTGTSPEAYTKELRSNLGRRRWRPGRDGHRRGCDRLLQQLPPAGRTDPGHRRRERRHRENPRGRVLPRRPRPRRRGGRLRFAGRRVNYMATEKAAPNGAAFLITF